MKDSCFLRFNLNNTIVELITELHTACRDNNITTVKRIIDENPDIINVAIDPSKVKWFSSCFKSASTLISYLNINRVVIPP